MTAVSAQAVSSLRSRTGVSILECKKALEDAGGDEERAIEILRTRGQASAVKKAERDQHEGALFIANKVGSAALVQLNCETDFVARNEDFQKIGQGLAESLLANGADGFADSVQETVASAVQQLGENISLGDFHLIEGDHIGSYVHSNRKIAVLVVLDGGNEEVAKDAAMHAAAMNPLYINAEEVPEEEVEKERAIWKEQLAKEGKPEQIMAKIMEGKEKKFREENALMTQVFVKDPSKTVGAHLAGGSVKEYIRLSIS